MIEQINVIDWAVKWWRDFIVFLSFLAEKGASETSLSDEPVPVGGWLLCYILSRCQIHRVLFFSLSFLSSGLLFNQKIKGLLLFSCQMETRNSHGHHISQLLSLSLISLGSFFLLPVYSLIQFFFFYLKKGYLIVLHACPIGLVRWTMAALWVDTNASKNVLLTVGYCNMIIHGYYPSLCSYSLDLSLLVQLFVNCWMTNLKWSFHFQ